MKSATRQFLKLIFEEKGDEKTGKGDEKTDNKGKEESEATIETQLRTDRSFTSK